jgi:hypothetical protein
MTHKLSYVYNVSSIKDSRWPQLLFKYVLVYKVIVWHNSETIVNFEPKSNSQYYCLSSVRNWQNTFQQGVDIFRKTFNFFNY